MSAVSLIASDLIGEHRNAQCHERPGGTAAEILALTAVVEIHPVYWAAANFRQKAV